MKESMKYFQNYFYKFPHFPSFIPSGFLASFQIQAIFFLEDHDIIEKYYLRLVSRYYQNIAHVI